MLVLKILISIALFALVVWGLQRFDEAAAARYGHRFFDTAAFWTYFIADLLLYFGYDWYRDALDSQGDTLNGALLMAFGATIVLLAIRRNLSRAGLLFGLVGSLLQIVVFAVVSWFAFWIAIALLLFLAETRPVVNLNESSN